MKKNILLLFAALLPLVASAHDFEVDGIYYNITSEADKQAEVTFKGDSYYSYWDEYSGSINIPATVTYDGVAYSVTSIGEYAFSSCSSLTAITFPEGVTSIGEYAFSGTAWYNNQPNGVLYIGNVLYEYKGEMPANTSIEVREGTVSISSYAFYDCSSLTDITLPEGVTSIGEYAFSDCSSLTTITIPENSQLTSIGSAAFYDCSSLTAITIPENSQLTSIGSDAFQGCSSLTAINIPEGVTSIGDFAFQCCSSLTAITIPEGVTSIGEFAFYECSSLTAVHISSIEAWCKISFDSNYSNPLYYAHNLYLNEKLVTELVIPEGVTSIGDVAFCDCSSLTTITIPEGVTSIGYGAFRYCSSLTAITIPEGVTSIGEFAFYNCSSLTTITCHAATPPTIDGSYTFNRVDKSIPVYVPAGSVEAYKAAEGWSEFSNIVPISLGNCATPIISYADGKLLFACDTEGAEIKTRVVTENDSEYTGAELEFIPTHTFTAYATKEKYEDSDVATLTICWIPCSEAHESEETSILTIPSKPVLISARDGVLTLSGLAEGTEVTLYTTDGAKVAQQQSSAGEATFTVDTNQVYLVHIGDKVVKIGM